MARARNIKPGFFANDSLAECDPLARLLFIGLWCICDREGRLEDRPKKIKVQTLPFDNCDIDALLSQLSQRGFIDRYQSNGCKVLQVNNFTKHQKPHVNEPPSTYQAPTLVGAKKRQAPTKHPPSTHQIALNDECLMMNTECLMLNDESGKLKEESPASPELPPILDNDQFKESLTSWLAYKSKAHRFNYEPEGMKAMISRAANLASEHGLEAVIMAMQKAMANSWKGWDQDSSFTTKAGKNPQDPRGTFAAGARYLAARMGEHDAKE